MATLPAALLPGLQELQVPIIPDAPVEAEGQSPASTWLKAVNLHHLRVSVPELLKLGCPSSLQTHSQYNESGWALFHHVLGLMSKIVQMKETLGNAFVSQVTVQRSKRVWIPLSAIRESRFALAVYVMDVSNYLRQV